MTFCIGESMSVGCLGGRYSYWVGPLRLLEVTVELLALATCFLLICYWFLLCLNLELIYEFCPSLASYCHFFVL